MAQDHRAQLGVKRCSGICLLVGTSGKGLGLTLEPVEFMSVFQDRASGEGCLAEFAIPNQIRDRASGEGCLAEFAIPKFCQAALKKPRDPGSGWGSQILPGSPPQKRDPGSGWGSQILPGSPPQKRDPEILT